MSEENQEPDNNNLKIISGGLFTAIVGAIVYYIIKTPSISTIDSILANEANNAIEGASRAAKKC